MTIAAAVLADAPLLYWKLDDPTGPAASDSSGNGRPGFYAGLFNLGLPGPEAGTLSALLQTGGYVLSVAPSPKLGHPWSMDVWLAPVTVMPTSTVLVYNGLSNSTGDGLVWAPVGQQQNAFALIRGGLGIGGAIGGKFPGSWHHYALTVDAGGNYNVYQDGVNVGVATLAANGLAATDPFVVGGVGAELAYVAHAAFYGVALTPARVLAHFNGAAALQTPEAVQGTATVTTGLATILTDLTQLLGFIARDLRNTP